jgi:hypothetical protein
MLLVDLINEWISESPLFEQAYRRRKAADTVLYLGSTFSLHLLKTLVMPKHEAYNHWINELNGYCYTLNNLYLKPKKKKLEGKVYYEYLFVGPLGGMIELGSSLRVLYRQYNMLELNTTTQQDILVEIEKIIHKLSYDFATNKYTGSIEDYIK